MLVLAPTAEWSRPLRGAAKDITFVSFQVYASENTVIEVGGARLGVTASSSSGRLQLMYDNVRNGALQWRGLGVIMAAEPYNGTRLAPLPILTVRLDPEMDVWDLYSDSRLLAHGLPLIASKKDDRKITVKPGVAGAWVCGLVLSDENPLYEDTNSNGLDDRFEQKERGSLLARNVPEPVRAMLANRWKASQRENGTPVLYFKRPLPDRILVANSTSP